MGRNFIIYRFNIKLEILAEFGKFWKYRQKYKDDI